MLDELFATIGKMHNTVMPLAAIWMKTPVMTANGATIRLSADALVRVENGELINCSPSKPANCKVIECRGTLYNSFEITVQSLKDETQTQVIPL